VSGLIKFAKNVISSEIDGLDALIESIDESFLQVISVVENIAGKVVLSGMGKSGYIAQKIAATLSSTGTHAVFLHPAEASHGDLGIISKNDIVILLSNSGETQELNAIINHCKRLNIKIIGVTRNQNSLLYEVSDIKILIPNTPEATNIGVPTTSTTTMLAWGDALAVTLLHKKGFSEEDFRALHPGGNIGVQLMKIKDLMHKGEDIPLIKADSSFSEMILEITRKSFGCVGVIDDYGIFIGIVTDGDLRRNIELDFKKSIVLDFMTQNPLTIDQDVLAIQAFNLMNDNGITNLFIVDDNKKPIGIVHIHDLIRAGIS